MLEILNFYEYRAMREGEIHEEASLLPNEKRLSPLGSFTDERRIEALFSREGKASFTHRRSLLRKCKIHEALATETLSAIFLALDDTASIHSVRRVCRIFEQAAWPAFASTFNNRVFHATEESLNNLRLLASNVDAILHLKKLNISTVKPIPNLATLLGQVTYYRYPRRQLQHIWKSEDDRRANLTKVLRAALAQLKNLETICVVDGDELPRFRRSINSSEPTQSRSAFEGGQVHDKKAHRHTLEIVCAALSIAPDWRCPSSRYLPKLKNLTTAGRMSVASLPGCPCRESRPSKVKPNCYYLTMTQITLLDLAITDDPEICISDDTNRIKVFRHYLPDFLACTPNLADLTLRFPRPARSEDGNVWPSRMLYGNEGFEAIADTLYLPNLTTLHLAHLNIIPHSPLSEFLFRHRRTLTHAKFTSLALGVPQWRPFMHFLADKMDLHWLSLARDLTPEEEITCALRWACVPEMLELTANDYEMAAKKGTKLVSKSGSERLFKGTEYNNVAT